MMWKIVVAYRCFNETNQGNSDSNSNSNSNSNNNKNIEWYFLVKN